MRILFFTIAVALLSGCGLQHFHADSSHWARCILKDETGQVRAPHADEIVAVDIRTGWPLLSTPHPFNCRLNPETGRVAWESENRSESSFDEDIPSKAMQSFNWGFPGL